MLYFSYGSNMSVVRLRARVARAEPLGVAVLTGHRLCFHKAGHDQSAKCDARYTGCEEDVVIGVLFELPEEDKPVLDGFEGLGRGYEVKIVALDRHDGSRVEAYTYYATAIDPGLRPYHWYKDHVLRGAREHGLPLDYCMAIECIESVTDPQPERQRQEMSIYRD